MGGKLSTKSKSWLEGNFGDSEKIWGKPRGATNAPSNKRIRFYASTESKCVLSRNVRLDDQSFMLYEMKSAD